MVKKKKRSKRVNDKDVLFRNVVFGTIFSIINFIIICVVYYFLMKNPEYRAYLDDGMTIFSYDLTGNQVTVLTFVVSVITPLFFLVRIILLGLWHILTAKNDFITILLNLAVNFMILLVIIGISLFLFFIYNIIIGYIFT